MKIALIFPGQGSQVKGMGKEILENYPHGYELIGEANCTLGYNLEELIMEDPEGLLNNTKYTQPALYTVSAIYTNYLREKGISWHTTAGHSLGEYSALYAAGVYSFIDGLNLVKKRGELMEEINDPSLGMAAILGLSGADVAEAIKLFPDLYIANLNSPEQTVISGKKDSIEKLSTHMKENKMGRLIPLRVKGAFHSPFMKPVEEEFKKAIAACHFNEPEREVYPNVKARVVSDSETIKACLIEQVSGQVRWTDTVKQMEMDGITHHFEAGPGKVLAGLMKKCTKEIVPLVID